MVSIARKPSVAVMGENPDVNARVLDALRTSGLVDVNNARPPDLICVGCADHLPVRQAAAVRLACGLKPTPIVLMTSQGSEELAVQALRSGFSEYLKVPFSRDELRSVLLSLCPVTTDGAGGDGGCLLGESYAIREVKSYASRVARTTSNVLITGETGSGKELVAQLIHTVSPRGARAFVSINCAAIPDTLFESELFGYERGAFTGAHRRQDGKLRLAEHGTVFLDEIGDMSLYAQAKVLRLIESREIQRLGSRKPELLDVRIIAATNCDLASMVRQGKFRQDLLFRLGVAQVHLPPLRQRKGDILLLADFFRDQNNRKLGWNTIGFTTQARKALLRHDWPGNIRELRNVVESAFIDLEPNELMVEIGAHLGDDRKPLGDLGEIDRILTVLEETRWNRSKAAERLQWSRMTLYRKMFQYKLSDQTIRLRSARP